MHLRDVEALGDLRLRDRLVKAQVDDHALAPGEDPEGSLEIRAVLEELEAGIGDADGVGERLRLFVGLAGDFAIEREQVVRLTQLLRLENLVFAGAGGARPAPLRSGCAQRYGEFVAGAVDREIELLQAARNLDRPAFIAKVALDLADDRRRRVGRELDAALEIETVDRLEQPDGSDLHEVVERLPAIGKSHREKAHEIEMNDDELVAQSFVLGFRRLVGLRVTARAAR